MKTADGQRQPNEIASVPLATETACVTKRFRTAGRVRVKTSVVTQERTLTEELRGEEIEIERVPRNVPVETIPEVRVENGVTIIPLVAEQLVVEKRLVLVEELYLHRVETKETVEVPVELRTERAEIERIEVNPPEKKSRS